MIQVGMNHVTYHRQAAAHHTQSHERSHERRNESVTHNTESRHTQE